MTLFIALILLYQFEFSVGWYFLACVLWLFHLAAYEEIAENACKKYQTTIVRGK